MCLNTLVGWLEFNVPFQHKYGYIRDEPQYFTQEVHPLGNTPQYLTFALFYVVKIDKNNGF